MRRALVLATVAALAVARPEMYREKEDFQFSRSSSDEGKKEGFYGAQRGNMGGNYERAHNMDVLAQHQMGGLVRTVDGELGDGAKQRSGSVFSAANSRGIYGSGHYDLSNVQGRNFQEGTSYGSSSSQSSLASSSQQAAYGSQTQSYSSAANNAYGSQSHDSGYGNGYNAGTNQAQYASNSQSADDLQSARQYDRTLSSQAAGYQSQSGYQGQSVYDQSAASHLSSNNAYGTSATRGSHYRLVGASPVRVYIRPGSTVAIPVAAQSLDATRGASSSYDLNSQSSSAGFNQNSITSEAESLGTDQQNAYKPANGAKHYESSYSYRKEWEKHDTVTSAPLSVPTVNPYPSNSELYEDTQAHGSEHREAQDARHTQSSSQYTGYNVKSALRHQATQASRAQEYSSSSNTAGASSLASSSSNNQRGHDYAASANLNSANLNSQVEDIGSKPKSYQSSYSYHKSWERQGDPYVIKPSTNGLYTLADSQASQRLTSSSSNQASSYGSQRHSSNYLQGHQGHSYNPNGDCDESGHIRMARSVNLGLLRSSYQQSQNTQEGQEYVGQQSQRLEDFGQQPQDLQNFGQESQNLNDFGQQSQNLADFGQQSQNLENLGQQSQNLEDFGQQSQNLEDLGQQSQKLEDFGQQSQKLEDFGQQSQKLEDFGQQTQDAGQLTQHFDKLEDQQTQSQWNQQSQTDAGQETQNTWMHETIQQSQDKNDEQQTNLKEIGFDRSDKDTPFQSNVFEMDHPSLNRPESQKQDLPNPFANTIFDEHRYPEKTELGKEGVTQVSFVRQPGQQIQVPLPPNMNQNNQNVYFSQAPFNPDRQSFSDWQKYTEAHSNTGYGHNNQGQYQSGYGTHFGPYVTSYGYRPQNQWPGMYPPTNGDYPSRPYPGSLNTQFSSNTWMFPPPQSHYHNTNFQHYGNEDAFTHTETFINHSNHSTYSTSNDSFSQTNGQITPSTNLFDIMDDLEKKVTLEKETVNSYQENTQKKQINNTSDLSQNLDDTFFHREEKIPYSVAPLPSTTESNIITTTNKQDNLRPHKVERGDIEPEKLKPQEEAGRGDIGPEDNYGPDFPNQPLQILGITPTKPTIEKTLEEIEHLSLWKENKTTFGNAHSTNEEKQVNLEKDDMQFEKLFGVLGLDDQNVEHSEQDNLKLQNDWQKTTSTTPKISYYHVENFNIERENQHNTEQQFENTRQVQNIQQTQNSSYQHHINIPSSTQRNNENQTNLSDLMKQMKEALESFDQQQQQRQQNENSEQQLQQFNNFGQKNEGFQQESVSDFGQQESQNVGQQSENSEQQLQQFDDFGQKNEGFQQESVSEFGQQQSQNVGQQSENSEQQLQHFNNFGQKNEGFQQESIGDFGQQESQNVGKQSEDLGQQHQQFHDFGQENEGFQQESVGDFGQQQSQNVGQQSEDLGQQLQQFDNFGQNSEDFQQESLREFGQHNENLGQQLQQFNDFGQKNEGGQEKENIEQQNQSTDFQRPNSEQQQSSQVLPPSADNKEGRAPSHVEPVVEPEMVTKKAKIVETPPVPVTQKSKIVETPPEPQPGFWSRVGNKISGAKDSVVSWFSSG